MSKHNKHSCECKHESLQLCKCCNVAYCVDCGEEWKKVPLYNWSYTNTWPYNGLSQVNSTSGLQLGQNTMCKHEG